MKLITNFKKVRKLVKDPRITSYCLRHSNHLQVFIKSICQIRVCASNCPTQSSFYNVRNKNVEHGHFEVKHKDTINVKDA